MPIDTADARALLQVPPDKYVEERNRLVKQAKADKDRALAEFYQSLKRPALSLWAVLAAGENTKAVNEVVSITSKLGKTQASAGTASAVSAATKDRRKAIEGLVDRAVKALAADDKSAEARRAEIREIVDQLSRHPELANSWIDGTLRELPEEEFGFGAFDVVAMPASPPKAKEVKPEAGKSKVARDDDASARVPTRAERAAKAEATKQARKDVSDAARAVSEAERRVRSAEAEVRKAEKTLREAEAALDNANRRHAAAVTHADAL